MSKPNSKLNRLRHKAVADAVARDEFLQANRVGTVAFVGDDGFPYQIPIAYGLVDGTIYLHGSSAAGGLRQLADGRQLSFGVFRQTGLVLARSAFESSMHYASYIGFGAAEVISDESAKDKILLSLTEFLFPGRSAELRSNSKKELAATLLLKLQIESWSFKISNEMPDDPEADLSLQVWAGVVPIQSIFTEPIPAPDLDSKLLTPPSYIKDWQA